MTVIGPGALGRLRHRDEQGGSIAAWAPRQANGYVLNVPPARREALLGGE